MTSKDDDAKWLVIADQLSQEDHPLGEYLVLALRYDEEKPPESKHRRMRALIREWEARFKKTAKFDAWYRTGLLVHFKDAKSVLKYAGELARTRLPLRIEVGDGSRSVQACYFDADCSRLAWMESTYTVSNQNFSPGMDEDYHHSREIIVWRVADKAVLFERSFSAEWDRLEFRGDELYAIEGAKSELVGAWRK